MKADLECGTHIHNMHGVVWLHQLLSYTADKIGNIEIHIPSPHLLVFLQAAWNLYNIPSSIIISHISRNEISVV